MKCLILAGGHGERLWPLSRKNYPKQFIQIQKNHSIFQETIARNIPYCDSFIIVTGYEYRFIIENQMKAFQGTSYRCVFEKMPRNTTSAVTLPCLGLPLDELVFVVAADHLIDSTSPSNKEMLGYKDAILKAKEYALSDGIALFGMEETEGISSKFGYITGRKSDGSIDTFLEKPNEQEMMILKNNSFPLRNIGMFLFRNEIYQKELKKINPILFNQCRYAYTHREAESGNVVYTADIQSKIASVSIEKSLIEKTDKLKAVSIGFRWSDVGDLEDLANTNYPVTGICVKNNCNNTVVINDCSNKAVVVNSLEDVTVVNTADAVYVGKYGTSSELKTILRETPSLIPYTEKSTLCYRLWGYYEQLAEETSYRIRKVVLFSGKTIYFHKHSHQSENWTIVQGKALVTLDGIEQICTANKNIDIPIGVTHQISNIGKEPVIFVETSVGLFSEKASNEDDKRECLNKESMILLSPSFKDYLWGGTKLRDVYRKQCDYSVIAESWELSAHPAGQSIVASGVYKGLTFSEYLEIVGKEAWGWKCSPLQQFPLMIKFIDAKENLSVQVHPNDEYALKNENSYGKNEMWYVIASEPDSGLYVGFNRDVTKEQVEESIKDHTIMSLLNFYPTKAGDVFFIPAGTVHAIGAGNLICEIQQSSNCTYRLYDYDRCDPFGNLRELHLKEALDVLCFEKYHKEESNTEKLEMGRILSQCKYFESIIYDIDEEQKIELDDSVFYSVICLKGNGKVELSEMDMEIKAGDSIFIPAVNGELNISGSLTIILSHI